MKDHLGLLHSQPEEDQHDVFVSRATVPEVGDAPSATATPYDMLLDDTFVGQLDSFGDRDWVAITLAKGETYDIDLMSLGLADPYLRLYDWFGNLVAKNDDANFPAGNLNSQITFTAPYSGTYYVDAGAYGGAFVGYYALSVEVDYSNINVSDEQFAKQLTDGYWEAFGSSRAAWDTAPGGSLTYDVDGLTADGRYLAQQALLGWTMVTGIAFVRVSGGADITFDDEEPGAYASTASAGGQIVSAQINIDDDWIASYGAELDGYSFQAYLHETGHALGLGHAGDYNGDATFGIENDFANDSWHESIMSYFAQDDNPNVDADFAFVITPMKADIIAMQDLYGIAGTIRTGDTTYGYNGNTGTYLDDIVSMNEPVAFTILDDGGFDTLDLSGTSADQHIDLRVGARSDVLGLTGNLTIADGTRIELLIGGTGVDHVFGSMARNKVQAGPGNDILWGNNGGDRLEGGGGADYIDGGAAADRLYGDGGRDRLFGRDGNDRLWGNGGQDLLRGGGKNDLLIGGTGADRLFGQRGADTLKGGRGDGDVLNGGAGRDEFVFRSSFGADTIADFERGRDMIVIETGADDFADLTITDSVGGAVVTFSAVSITVSGVAVADLDSGDFLFA